MGKVQKSLMRKEYAGLYIGLRAVFALWFPGAKGMIDKAQHKRDRGQGDDMAQRARPWISAAMAKFAPAPRKRPKQVQKAKAVARIAVLYCSGSHRLKMAKLPPASPKKNRIAMKGVKPVRQIEGPAKSQHDGRRHAGEISRQGFLAAKTLRQNRRQQAAQDGADGKHGGAQRDQFGASAA